ncbi:glycosyltransferase [Niallia sp.]|uniref:glycosyltransferase n=1 Tax=Niallia sp. TaxID=2837523 RepID=UPI00289ACCB6|nr:glycosyltransferase [Niallia sp.]
MNILYISQELPYEKVPHAGGQSFYNYLVELSKENNIVDLSFYKASEININEILLPSFKVIPIKRLEKTPLIRAFSMVLNLKFSFLDIFNYRLMVKHIKRVLNDFEIDIIQLEWTSSLIFAPFLKKEFPSLKIVVCEHDVNFLRLERIWKNSSSIINKIKNNIKYKIGKKQELRLLNYCDLILTLNYKDKKLLVENNISEKKIQVICPYYNNSISINNIEKKDSDFNLLFYGAMNRVENYLSVINFIETVYKDLYKYTNGNISFYIVGNKPHERLLEYHNKNNIYVTGFVNDPSYYFNISDLFVAPLILGAGIKIKVLEAMASGLPVVTNEIGIEGINAIPNKEYIHFTDYNEMKEIIINFVKNKNQLKEIGNNGKLFVDKNFNFKNSVVELQANYENMRFDKL